MSKKEREFEVEIVDVTKTLSEVKIGNKTIGNIVTKNESTFEYYDGKQKLLGSVSNFETAVSSVLTNFNLNN